MMQKFFVDEFMDKTQIKDQLTNGRTFADSDPRSGRSLSTTIQKNIERDLLLKKIGVFDYAQTKKGYQNFENFCFQNFNHKFGNYLRTQIINNNENFHPNRDR